jgi:hypothetical protein
LEQKNLFFFSFLSLSFCWRVLHALTLEKKIYRTVVKLESIVEHRNVDTILVLKVLKVFVNQEEHF